MRVEDLSHDPLVAAGLDMQRELSRARSTAEMTVAAAHGIGRITKAQHLIVVVPSKRAAGPGPGLVAEHLWLGDPDLTPDRFGVGGRPMPVALGTPLYQLIADGRAKLASEVDIASDPILAATVDGATRALVVPLVYDGEVREWLTLWWAGAVEVDAEMARLAISNLNLLARSLEQAELREEVHALSERLAKQVKEVADVQRSILPARPPEIPGYEIAVHYTPCQSAGGDYYDFRDFAGGQTGFVVADVSGHGPGAAVVMAMMRTAMASYRISGAEAVDVVRHVNRVMFDGAETGTFVTALFMLLEPLSGEVNAVSAGHLPPRLLRADGRVEVGGMDACLPIGVMAETDVTRSAPPFYLAPGDRLFLHTDGFNEARAPNGELFGYDRLDQTLGMGDPNEPSSVTLSRLVEAVVSHEQGAPQADDRCAVVVRRLSGDA
ncbi:MAG: hypothetical protein CMJ31_11455 [Phycisphaerae bacterium]|nr:hypothetical protein [Phycisphaerae bacterium]